MHRSRISLVLIDHPEDTWAAGLAFWAGVQGVEPVQEQVDMPEFRVVGRLGSVPLEVQRTGAGTAARIHLDIETDDVGAEVTRVVALGATVRDDNPGWTVLTDPGGLAFCVVPVQEPEGFDREARSWR